MGDQTVNIRVTGDTSGVQSALNAGAAAGQQFAAKMAGIGPVLESGASAEQAFTAALQQMSATIGSFQSGLESIPERLEQIGESFHHVRDSGHEAADTLGKVEHAAEMREASQSIREAIEHPLDAARKAAESFFLSFGQTGLAATATLAIGGAAVEAALHVGELGHEYTVLAGELNITPARAERLSRAFQLVGADTGSLIMANRTLSRVLSDGSESSRKIREDLAAQGVELRDLTTGAYKPFDELVLEIISTLSKSTNTNEANRLGAEVLGRTYLRLAGIARELPEAFQAATGGLSDKEIEQANKYEFGWKKIKLAIGDAVNTVGIWLIKMDEAAGRLDKLAGTELFKERKPSTYVSKQLAPLGGVGPSYAPAAPAISPEQMSNSKALAASAEANKNALRPLGGEAAELEKKFTDLQKDLGAYDRASDDTVTSSGKTVAALRAEVEATRARIESLKAQGEVLRINEASISTQEKAAVAGVEFEKKVYTDRQKIAEIGAIELVKVDQVIAQRRRDALVGFINQELALETAAIDKRIALQKREEANAPSLEKREAAELAIINLQAERAAAIQKANSEIESANTALSENGAKLNEYLKKQQIEWANLQEEAVEQSNKIWDSWAKEQKARLDEVAVATRNAQANQAKASLDSARRALEDERSVRLKQIQDNTAGTGDIGAARGYQQRIAAIQEYDAKILRVIEDLGALAIAEGRAKDAESNRKYVEGLTEKGQINPAQAVIALDTTQELGARNAAVGGGITNAGETSARAQAAKSTNEFLLQEKKTLDELNIDFQKNIGSKFFGQLNSGFQGALQGWISGTKNFGQAWAEMGQRMVSDMLTNLAMIGIHFAEMELKNLILHTVVTQQQVGITAAGAAQTTAISAATGLKQLTHSAAVAAGKAWSALADIPIVGPALGAAAAAATYAGVLALAAFEKGGIVGGNETLALLHPHEMVLPAHISQSVQNFASGSGQNGQPAGGSGDMHNHVHYHAAPGDSPETIRRNSDEILKIVRKGMRGGKLSPA